MTQDTPISEALVDRMAALVRQIAIWSPDGYAVQQLCGAASAAVEARAIVAELPKPVDPDLIEARKLAHSVADATDTQWSKEPFVTRYKSGKLDKVRGSGIPLALAAIKRGRELERDS